MELIKIALASLASLAALFILTKFMGNRQISQLTMFDYINGITIGSIAAEMATSLEDDILKPLTAMVIYTVVVVLISLASSKWSGVKRFFGGRSLVIMSNGKIFKNNLKKAKLDLNEFLIQCRVNGYFNLDDIETAVFESNGRITFLPKACKRPVRPEDVHLFPNKAGYYATIISDGEVLFKNLHAAGKNEIWLKKELKRLGYNKYSEVFYAASDGIELMAYGYDQTENQNDIFQ
ncbi:MULTISPECIES: DUF421 domain-containing protein [unclassified Ruminococcus]|uniref:DUF421 domain-containing protein n=1 Tax=unclassified Ruminococcus TaxID=2608920 RepID=UPI00210D126B|nr:MULTISPECIES: DUF421 domain-containing protein [unclassified Ruminococcus]MCQ4022885.1 DUF421 domain-containing protein [Ruminococcus sp. zg-924]MCQ4115299.1 DUF421 domain-containing protein [Ruminococcus sp. zg-921]